MVKDYKGEVIHLYKPRPRVKRDIGGRTAILPRQARVTVLLEDGQQLSNLPDDGYAVGDPIILTGDLQAGGQVWSRRAD